MTQANGLAAAGGAIALCGIVPFMLLLESDTTAAFLALAFCVGLGAAIALLGIAYAWLRRR